MTTPMLDNAINEKKETPVTEWDMTLRALPGIPQVKPGDDIGQLIIDAAAEDGLQIADGDLLVVAQKIVSKSEDRVVALDTVTPSDRARRLAERTDRDPRLVQLYLDESQAVLQIIGRHVVTLDNRGIVDTAGGVDSGNAGVFSEGWACLLPVDPDASARRIRDRINELLHVKVAVIVSDSLGGPYREGSHGAAIGLAGIVAVEQAAPDEVDLYGNPVWGDLNRVDELAGAATALMGQANESRPVIIVRGAPYTPTEQTTLRDLLVKVPIPEVNADLKASS
jgi:coenzyme F420-0:L-glutamate ligase/coenzyme F420-1:gamma-L-glutamate ligase